MIPIKFFKNRTTNKRIIPLIGLLTCLIITFSYSPAFKVSTGDFSETPNHLIYKTSGFWVLNETIDIEDLGTLILKFSNKCT
ncbi:MAG: hypothetical protein JW891_16840 [Candidatus Lokiarchaeota archaeon]|nr:hypothetical protein [Candidatus Lokiarchaeota archaeon]